MRAEFPKDGNEREIKEWIKQDFNGEYATKICSHCGIYHTDPSAQTEHAIIDLCDRCFRLKAIEQNDLPVPAWWNR